MRKDLEVSVNGIRLSTELAADHDKRRSILICLMTPADSRESGSEQSRMLVIIQFFVIDIEDEQRGDLGVRPRQYAEWELNFS